ncbi:MAG: UDP-N-acetylmuramoyl-L-alanine--D-glutamate ligase, partial [Planctomycetota bacterium]
MSKPINIASDECLRTARITVMGLGHFGGQLAVIHYLANLGCELLVTDMKSENDLKGSLEEIRSLVDSGQVELRLGEHNVSDFTTCDLVVASPAVPHPWDNRYLRSAEAAGIPITTEIALTAARIPEVIPVVGITGSAGKSTTAAMTAHILRSCAKEHTVHLGGNIGAPLLEHAHKLGESDLVVLELSSFQLHWLAHEPDLRFKLAAAIFTNYAPNHLDWHRNEQHYFETKASLARYAEAPVLVADKELHDRLYLAGIDSEICDNLDEPIDLPVPGGHNVRNARTAIAGARSTLPNLSADEAAASLRSYASLPHRLQPVPTGDDFLSAFNDSKSTTPEATTKAVAAFDDPSQIILIAGGYDKEANMSPMIECAQDCAHVFTIGTTGPAIAKKLANATSTKT